MANFLAPMRADSFPLSPDKKCFFICLALALLSGCASRPEPVSVSLPSGELKGFASWYGRPYHGRKTANGETYDMEDLTAAHRTLPFNSRVRVERRDNGRDVEVRINDRGPFVEGRVIDLSRAAARRLDMLKKGVAPVRLAPLRVPRRPSARWLVLVGGFSSESAARRLARRIRGGKVRIIPGWHGDRNKFHLQVKGIRSQSRAEDFIAQLKREGRSAFLVRER